MGAETDTTGMTAADTLLAIEEIKNLKAAYFRAMDTKSWAELDTLFAEDATFDPRNALEMPRAEDAYDGPILSGRAEIVAYISSGLAPLISVHQGHVPEIEILSPTTAKGVWPMTDILVPPEGGPFKVFKGYGHYWETYAKVDGRWRIATSRLRRLWVETV